jgi:hypothetical protein
VRNTIKALITLPAALAIAVTGAAGASAQESYTLELTDTMGNGSGSQSTATVDINGDEMTVSIEGTGFTPKQPHAQHFHGSFDENKDFTCPSPSADKDGDGQVNTEEGLPDYGNVILSLTTKGDTSAESGLAVDRFPVADADGNLSYERTIQLPAGAGDRLRNLHIVQHGLDVNGNDKYDLDALGESTFAKSLGVDGLPEEATNPATCGTVSGAAVGATPTGGVDTGTGSTQGPESLALLGFGGLALAGAGGALAYRRRLTQNV